MQLSKIIFMILLILCPPTLGQQTPGPVRTSIYNEIDKMLRDKEAFPKDSKQFQKLNDFRQQLRTLFQGQAGTSKVQEEEQKVVPPKEDEPSKRIEPSPKKKGKEEISEGEGTEETLPKTGQNKPKVMSMTDYAATMKHHKTLHAELQDVTAQGQKVKEMHSELHQLLQKVKNYHKNIASDGEVPADYDEVMKDFETKNKKYQQVFSEYNEALNIYAQHKAEYMKRLN